MANKEEVWWKVFGYKYISKGNIFILFLAIFGPTFWINYYQIPNINKEIYNIKEEIQKGTGLIIDNQVFEKRLENLEAKYIDVLASKDTINFWLTLFAVLLPVSLGLFVYQKGKFEDKAKDELEKVQKLIKEAREKIENLDVITESKIKEISDKAKEELIKFLSEADKQRLINKYFQEALNLEKEKKYVEQIDIYNKIIGIDNTNKFAYNYKSVALMGLSKFKEAEENLLKAYDIDNNYGEALYNFACLYSLQNKQQESIQYLEKFMNLGFFNDIMTKHFYEDKDFDNIKESKEFKDFLKKLKEKYPEN